MSQNIKKFTIITVCKNSKDLISETIHSVINQTIFKKKIAHLEYIIIDGNSTDGTTDIILDIKKKNSNIIHIIEDDRSLFDGLCKGLKKSTGDFVAYINAGDFYNLTAFEIINNLFVNNQDVNWVTGDKIIYNKNSEIIDYIIPYKYRSKLIEVGAYGKYLPFIQQESVFWRSILNKEINYDELQKLKRCGDLFIWKCFSKKHQLYHVASYLSGFKYHDNQLTFNETGTTRDYISEANIFIKKINIYHIFLIIIDSFFWFFLKYQKKIFLKKDILIEYNNINNNWILLGKEKSNILHCWLCDTREKNGESILSIKFCLEISNFYESLIIQSPFNTIFIVNGSIVKNIQKKEIKKLNFFHKYLSPFQGVIFLLYHHFIKKNKIGYINFLPLWNSLLFILLPSKTVLGPITGYKFTGKVTNLNSLIRKFIFPLLMNLSIKIINFKFDKIYFATFNLNQFKDKLSKSIKIIFGYSLIFLNKSSLNLNQKTIDFVIYYRNYSTKKPNFMKSIIEYLALNGKKIVTYGDIFETNFSSIDQKGMIDQKCIFKLLSKAKYTIISPENLFSLTFYESIGHSVCIFFNKNLSSNLTEKYLDEIFFPLDFDNLSESKINIINKLKQDNSKLKDFDILLQDLSLMR